MRWRILLLLASALLIGCSGGSVSGLSRDRDIFAEIWASAGCPGIGNPVKLRATVTNSSNRTEVVQLTNKPILDIEVRVLEGKTVRWSDSHPLTLDQTHMELKPGESRSIEMELVPSKLGEGTIPATVDALAIYTYRDAPSQGLSPIIGLGIGWCR